MSRKTIHQAIENSILAFILILGMVLLSVDTGSAQDPYTPPNASSPRPPVVWRGVVPWRIYCFESFEVISSSLYDHYGEVEVGSYTGEKLVVHMLTNEEQGTITVVSESGDGKACIVRSGENYRSFEGKIPPSTPGQTSF